MMDLLPSGLPDLDKGSEVAWDTETSGLFADDGARTSTVSVAWIIDEDEMLARWAGYENVTVGTEEIAPGYWVSIASVAWPFDQGVSGKPEDNGQRALFGEDDNLDLDEWVALCNWLAEYPLIAQNAPFDLEKMRVGVRRWPGVGVELMSNVIWDTQNVSHMLWPLERSSLKPTCARLFGQEWADESEVVKRYLHKNKLPTGRWDLMPWDVIGKYANTDARITLMLRLRQVWEIENTGAGSWMYRETISIMSAESEEPIAKVYGYDPQAVYGRIHAKMDSTIVAYKITRAGVPYDEVASREAGIECKSRAKDVEARLPFTPPTLNEAKRFFFTEGTSKRDIPHPNIIPYAVSEKTGEPSLTAEIALRMIDDGVPYADLWGEYSKVTTAASMWYDGYADKVGTDGRLRCAIRVNGTVSHRWSVERVNLQAIPQDYRLSEFAILDGIPTPRDLIAAAVGRLEGWRLFELDLAQAELRVATMFARCELMDTMIRDGEDLHTFTTKALFPQEDPAGPLFKTKFRQVGKRGNFSLCFGSKYATFRSMIRKETGIELGDIESARIVREWNALYPEFDWAIRRHQLRVAKRQGKHGFGWIDLLNGERRWFQPYEEAHKAFNQRVQSNLAFFGMEWMVAVDKHITNETTVDKRAVKAKIGHAGLILQIHDALLLLLPDNAYGAKVADECATIGKNLWAHTFPDIPGDVDYHEWRTA